MPKKGYKQSPEHKAKLAKFRNADAMKRLTAARVASIQVYMEACAKRHGFDSVDEYKIAYHQDYAQYRQERRSRGRTYLSFEDYLAARAARAKPGDKQLLVWLEGTRKYATQL